MEIGIVGLQRPFEPVIGLLKLPKPPVSLSAVSEHHAVVEPGLNGPFHPLHRLLRFPATQGNYSKQVTGSRVDGTAMEQSLAKRFCPIQIARYERRLRVGQKSVIHNSFVLR